MSRVKSVTHKFVEAIPATVEEGTLYISLDYAIAVHKCFCGCGAEVVTPLSPTDWKFIFNGETVSLFPSVGNWSFSCRSHYWIEEGAVQWAEQWSETQIKYGRLRDRLAKQRKYGESGISTVPAADVTRQPASALIPGIWDRLRRVITGEQ